MKRQVLLLLLLIWPAGFLAQKPKAVLLYGGSDHKLFLGCLNCGRFDSRSVCNPYSDYGSEFNPDSIWNGYGTYGSRSSSESPWNASSSDPPVIADEKGAFSGYFTTNTHILKRTTIPFLVVVLQSARNGDVVTAHDALCSE